MIKKEWDTIIKGLSMFIDRKKIKRELKQKQNRWERDEQSKACNPRNHDTRCRFIS